ncbi:MAG: efflux RND transporter periplasmic adaptor subunit [Deltaproteobacteria bacterium]|nr:efflux RND transporter periplasmic adaptor subunit [Deltaproteobacteria bacterium]
MIIKKYSGFFLYFIFFILILSSGGCSDDHTVYSGPPSKTYSLPVIEVQNKLIPFTYTTTGSVVSDISIEITSRITGFIQNISVREGEVVQKGRLLVTLDSADVEGAIRKAHAAVDKAVSALKDAETDAERFAALFKRGSASDNALRKAKLQRDIAGDSLKEAQAAFQTAVSQRNYTNITCPVDGVIIASQKRNGDLATPGAPILTVESARGLLFETYVAEARVGDIHIGDKVKVIIDALGYPLAGTAIRIVPSGDPVTRRYQVKIALPETLRLFPGMFGRVHFIIGEEQVLFVPQKSMICRGGLDGVFVLDKDNRIRFRWLRTARQLNGDLEVKAGLRPGERIVAIVQPDLRDGDLVNPDLINSDFNNSGTADDE